MLHIVHACIAQPSVWQNAARVDAVVAYIAYNDSVLFLGQVIC